MKTIRWLKKSIKIVDQTRLPDELKFLELKNGDDVYNAIKTLKVRGAPLLGVAGAYAVALEAQKLKKDRHFRTNLNKTIEKLAKARPTAINLSWALERLKRLLADPAIDTARLPRLLAKEAAKIEQEEIAACQAIGNSGAELISNGDRIMTYCNTGRLATPGIGTALGIIYTAQAQGKNISVFVSETRPLLQGARLTAFELCQAKIPVSLIADNMVATVMPEVDKVLVGADRIARNGDTANKIGTATLAITASYFNKPFYVAAPVSSFDLSKLSGSDIPIEYRDDSELTNIGAKRLAPKGVKVFNPAFDITPASLITAIITNQGILRPPFEDSINRLFKP